MCVDLNTFREYNSSITPYAKIHFLHILLYYNVLLPLENIKQREKTVLPLKVPKEHINPHLLF